MEKLNTKDALGNEIVMGNKYGYSQSKNGFTLVRIGSASSLTQTGKVTLKNVEAKISLYDDELKTEEHSDTLTCKPAMLFPVH